MKTLYDQLKGHDWYYGYSDDHRVWKRGQRRQDHLRKLLESLNCPYPMNELRMAVQNMVVGEFAEEEPDRWYRQPRLYKNVAPVRRSELLLEADQVQMLAWIESQGEQITFDTPRV
jgi:hypothetical protein